MVCGRIDYFGVGGIEQERLCDSGAVVVGLRGAKGLNEESIDRR